LNTLRDDGNAYLTIFELMKASFDLQPTLADDILILRPLKQEDLEDLYNVASDCLIWEQHPSRERCRRDVFELFFKDAMTSGGAFAVINKKTGQMIGSTRFQHINEADNAIEIGWTFLAREFWGGIYNRAMKRLMMDHAFQFVDNVLFYIDEKNLRSQKAVEKIGGNRITELGGVTLKRRPDAAAIFYITKKAWNEKQQPAN